MINIITAIVTMASLVGTIANSFKKRWCFFIWLFTNAFWCIYDLHIGAYAQSALFAVNFIICIVGLIRWKKGQDEGAGERG